MDDVTPPSQRKRIFQALSAGVGFRITDPDTITGHAKKRAYLECLEEYVTLLRDQTEVSGIQPRPIRRTNGSGGLRVQSIRAMLIRKQHELHELNLHQMALEKQYAALVEASSRI
ncbi:hypothetical protein C8Q76DRAFT_799653 [Earliella scabrosa]|nr:hypothetical protein C8Q76DRAFT_799653 [Earliella scabrosa]